MIQFNRLQRWRPWVRIPPSPPNTHPIKKGRAPGSRPRSASPALRAGEVSQPPSCRLGSVPNRGLGLSPSTAPAPAWGLAVPGYFRTPGYVPPPRCSGRTSTSSVRSFPRRFRIKHPSTRSPVGPFRGLPAGRRFLTFGHSWRVTRKLQPIGARRVSIA